MQPDAKNDFPTLREELSRKALETIEKIVTDEKQGRITKGQYAYAIDVLWSALAGLVDKDFVIIIEQMGNTRPDGSFLTKKYFRNDGGAIFRLVSDHRGKVLTRMISANGTDSSKDYDLTDEPNPCQAAKQKMIDIEDKLFTNGFTEI